MNATMHRCPAPGCRAQVPYHMLACKPHWFRVTQATRRRVWAAWADGAGAGTPEHTEAIDQAIREMADR